MTRIYRLPEFTYAQRSSRDKGPSECESAPTQSFDLTPNAA